MARTHKVKAVNLPALADWVANSSALFAEDSPFRANVTAGDPTLLVVTGENASGKSLLFRVVMQKVIAAGALPVTVSIRERAGGGLRQAFMFGEEHSQSTGASSVSTVARAFGNLDRPCGSVLGLDEPEMGLSDGYAHALGRYIGEQSRAVPRACAGVVVVSHSRSLVRGLLAGSGSSPTFVAVGHDLPLEDWLEAPELRSVEDLLALRDTGLERFRWAQRLLQGD